MPHPSTLTNHLYGLDDISQKLYSSSGYVCGKGHPHILHVVKAWCPRGSIVHIYWLHLEVERVLLG